MKVFYCIFILNVFFISTAFSQVNLSDGLVGCYPFSGNANDLSDKKNDGTVSGARLTTDRFGNPNSAYAFNGSEDYIEISPADLQKNLFSYSLWVYPEKLPVNDQAFFMISVGSATGDQDILIGNNYTGVLTGISNGSYIGYDYNVRCMTGSLPTLNQWYHIAMVKDQDFYHFYINGKLICSSPVNGADAYYGIGQVKAVIGARFNYGQHINAVIDDIHLYDRAINPEEVQALYKGSNAPLVGTVTIAPQKIESCSGNMVTLVATASPEVESFEWKVDGNVRSDVSGSEFVYELPAKGIDYRSTISVQTSYSASCFERTLPATDEITILIRNCDSAVPDTTLHVPTAFTPNRDGKNDQWEFYNLNAFPGLKIDVFSRWGEVIFHSENYTVPWHGSYKGKTVSPGTYPYQISYEGNIIKHGTVTVIH